MKLKSLKIEAPAVDAPVTMLELFFDLVFVFVVTQITTLIGGSDSWAGYGRAALLLAVTWWMYDGYAWMANNVPPITTSTRVPMLLAMAAFLAMAVVVPDAFGDGAWIFAIAYTVVVTIHAFLFKRSSVGGSARAILRILPDNYGVCLMLFIAAAAGPQWGWIAWVIALGIFARNIFAHQEAGFTLRSAHFAERHGLLIIIALGETIIAIGVNSQSRLGEPAVFASFGTAMALISALWWVYFGVGDDERGLIAISGAPTEQHTAHAFRSYSQVHMLHIAGLMLIAAGLRSFMHGPLAPLSQGDSVALSAGAAAFLLAQGAFRNYLGFASPRPQIIAALAIVAVTPLGSQVSGIAQLGAIATVTIALAAILQQTEPEE
jgi:low temperature requirement protein LtrA